MSKYLLTRVVSVTKHTCVKWTYRGRLELFSDSAVKLVSPDLLVNHQLDIDPAAQKKLVEGTKPKHHPGIVRVKQVQLPSKLQDAISVVVEKYQVDDLKSKSEDLAKYLWSRKLPVEGDELRSVTRDLKNQVIASQTVNEELISPDERTKFENVVKSKVLGLLRRTVYHWEPIKYDAYRSLLYLVGRMAFDYSAIFRIYSELSTRLPDFKPKTAFHFGSGVGSTIWAADSVWSNNISEHYCVDASDEMNTIARLLLQGGNEDDTMCIPGIYFRQFFPPSRTTKYDLVISTFSLMEFSSQEERLKVISDLWMKTQQFLIIVENGSNAGFNLVVEARDHILQNIHNADDNESNEAHVYAPCPHDKSCPRLDRDDGTPCNFEVDFKKLDLFGKSETRATAKMSFVVLRRGARDSKAISWPRIVRPVSTPSKSVQLRTCASNGQLEFSIITAAKHGRDLYACARACHWGDLLPVVPRTLEKPSFKSRTISKRKQLNVESNDSNVEVDAQTLS